MEGYALWEGPLGEVAVGATEEGGGYMEGYAFWEGPVGEVAVGAEGLARGAAEGRGGSGGLPATGVPLFSGVEGGG